MKSSLSLGTGIQPSSCQLLALHMRRHFLGFLGKQSFFCLSHEELGEMLSLDSLIWVWNCHGHFAPTRGFLGATGGHPVDGEYKAHRGEGRAERWKELGAWWHYLHHWKKKKPDWKLNLPPLNFLVLRANIVDLLFKSTA